MDNVKGKIKLVLSIIGVIGAMVVYKHHFDSKQGSKVKKVDQRDCADD